VHEIADAVDVKDDVILAVGIDDALELADHRVADLRIAL
jgi:predicted amidohydrolase YtcJ